MQYILENSTDQQFMLLTNHFETDTDAYRIQVFKMMGNNAYMMRNFLVKMLIVDILGICCAFLIGKYISDRILRPVEAIRSAAERISIEDLSQRISTEGPEDEMGRFSGRVSLFPMRPMSCGHPLPSFRVMRI